MRTTRRLPDTLFARAKHRAHAPRIPLTARIARGLECVLLPPSALAPLPEALAEERLSCRWLTST